MKNRIINLVLCLILFSCTTKNHQESAVPLRTISNEIPNQKTIADYFNIEGDQSGKSLLIWKKDQQEPFRWVGIEPEELKHGAIFRLKESSILILSDPGENSTLCFFKTNNMPLQFHEFKYQADSIHLFRLNDTLHGLELIWNYSFGPDVQDEHHTLLVGAKAGILPRLWHSTGQKSRIKWIWSAQKNNVLMLKNGQNISFDQEGFKTSQKSLTQHVFSIPCEGFEKITIGNW